MNPSILISISSGIILLLGVMHLAYTFYGPMLRPRDLQLIARSSFNERRDRGIEIAVVKPQKIQSGLELKKLGHGSTLPSTSSHSNSIRRKVRIWG